MRAARDDRRLIEPDPGADRDGVRKGTDPMAVTIAGIAFDRVRYDAGADVLYLHVGEPSTAVDVDASTGGITSATGPTARSWA